MLRPTDSVDAKLTPREAVLTRNAAELLGRDKIEHLNAMGNMMAQRGIDLPTLHAQYGNEDVMNNPLYYADGTNNVGYDPSYPGPVNPTGAGSGVPTQKGIGLGANILGNLLFPGAGMITGPMASWITKMIQGGASQNLVQKAVQASGAPQSGGGYGSQPVWGDNPYPEGFDPNASFNYGNPAGPNTQSNIGRLGSSGMGGGYFGSSIGGGNEQNFMPTLGFAMPDAGGGGAYGGNEMAKIALHGAFKDIATPEQYEYVKQFLSGGGGGGGGGKGVGGGGKPMTQAYAGGTSNVYGGGEPQGSYVSPLAHAGVGMTPYAPQPLLGVGGPGVLGHPGNQQMPFGWRQHQENLGNDIPGSASQHQANFPGVVGGSPPDRDFAHPMQGLMHPGGFAALGKPGIQQQPGVLGQPSGELGQPSVWNPVGVAGGMTPYGGGSGEPPGSYGANMKGFSGVIQPNLPQGQNWGGGFAAGTSDVLGGMPNRDFAHPMAGLMHQSMPGLGGGALLGESGNPMQAYHPPGLLGVNGPTPPNRDFAHPMAGLMHPGYAGGSQPGILGSGGGYGNGLQPLISPGGGGEPPGAYGANITGFSGGIQPSLPRGQNWGAAGFASGTSDVPGTNDALWNAPFSVPAPILNYPTSPPPISPSNNPVTAASSKWTPEQQAVINRIKSGQTDYTFGPWSPNPTREDLGTYVGGKHAPASGFQRNNGVALAPSEYNLFTPEQRRELGIMDIAPKDQVGKIERWYGPDSGAGGMQASASPTQGSFARVQDGVYSIDPAGDYAKAVAGTSGGGPSEFGEGVGRAGKALGNWGSHMADIAAQQAQTATSQGLSMVSGIGGNAYSDSPLAAYYTALQNPTVFR